MVIIHPLSEVTLQTTICMESDDMIDDLRNEHEKTVVKHIAEISALKLKYIKKHKKDIEFINEKHAEEISKLKKEHNRESKRLMTMYQKQITDMDEKFDSSEISHADEIKELKKELLECKEEKKELKDENKELKDDNKELKDELKELKKEFAAYKASSKKKIYKLKSTIVELEDDV
jgi:predicted  nucleic acid-binding Zn-ribbon protein